MKLTEWLAANAQTVTNATKASMQSALNAPMMEYLNKNMHALQDGVYIGKAQRETWGTYMRCEAWQTTNIGITAADADAIVIQYGGYRLGIALTEPTSAMSWGSKADADSIGYQKSSELNCFDGKARTDAIMKSSYNKDDDAATYAVAYAHAYSKSHTGDPGGDGGISAGSWYLPTMGDLALIHQHFETINLALQRIKDAGKQSATLLTRAYYWSCMEASGASAWYLNFSTGLRGGSLKVAGKLRVRPVTAF